MYVSGPLGRRICGPVVDRDRSAGGRGGGGVVWVAQWDRGGVQGPQTGRVARGTDQTTRSRTDGTALVSDGGSDLMGGERGRGGGSDGAGERVRGVTGAPHRATGV